MKLTLEKIRTATELLMSFGHKTFPVKMSYAVVKNSAILKAEYDNIEKMREEICKRYADTDNDGNPKIIEDENGRRYALSEDGLNAFAKEYNELLATETEVEGLHEVSLDVIEQCEMSGKYDSRTTGELAVLDFMFTE